MDQHEFADINDAAIAQDKARLLSENAGPPLLAIVGPTAVGKTAVGMALAQALDGEIISADAVAVYQGLDIGAAKPTLAEQALVRFHGIDVVAPDQEFTVADFIRLADAAIADIRRRGKVPIVVGGTGLYVRGVTALLSVPNVPPQPQLRAHLWAEVETEGTSLLYQRLQQVDAKAAAKILPGDAKRIIRALEVYMVTGRPMSSFHTEEGVQGVPRPNTWQFGLTMARETLYRRIESRVDAMMDSGFLEEVRGLLARGYTLEQKAMQSLGYRHLVPVVQGTTSLDLAIAELKRDTRRFAKRQLTWFQADKRVHWLSADSRLDDTLEKITAGDAPAGSEEAGDFLSDRQTILAQNIVRLLREPHATKQQ